MSLAVLRLKLNVSSPEIPFNLQWTIVGLLVSRGMTIGHSRLEAFLYTPFCSVLCIRAHAVVTWICFSCLVLCLGVSHSGMTYIMKAGRARTPNKGISRPRRFIHTGSSSPPRCPVILTSGKSTIVRNRTDSPQACLKTCDV